jgi:23S rRNA (cytosine1962-C5)-methyltransferase
MTSRKPRPFRPNPKFAEPALPGTKPAQKRAPVKRPDGGLPEGQAPLILEVSPGEDFTLVDSGDGAKLERFGRLLIVRPEGQAIWRKALDQATWQKADAVFTGATDEEGVGRWKLRDPERGDTFALSHTGLPFLGRFTSFRHVGIFPEQAPHWAHMEQMVKDARQRTGGPVKVLNLFGYTGIASLLAARAGAEVTHIDASKKAIGWARENQGVAGLNALPIRWICDDAMLFVEREIRRGNRYDIILADPPAYGRGPNGEVWQLFEDLPHLVAGCRDLLTPAPLAFVLTAYSIRASFYALHTLMRDLFAGRGGLVQSGELVIREESANRHLSTSLFSRWVSQ